MLKNVNGVLARVRHVVAKKITLFLLQAWFIHCKISLMIIIYMFISHSN
jgi:hypothetical protein